MIFLAASDLHLTTNPRDSARWGLFAWLKQQATQNAVPLVVLNGDTTDAKDRHPSLLVNRLVLEIVNLAKICKIVILCGNHDYIDAGSPFFKFLSQIDNVHFITSPTEMDFGSELVLFLPHTRTLLDWNGLNFSLYDYIFCHQTFNGAISENGSTLEGLPTTIFKECKGKVLSGDIHVPQIVNGVEYIGAPWRCHFGDSYTPRVWLEQPNGQHRDLHYPSPNKHLFTVGSLQDLEKEQAEPDDQVRIRVKLKRGDFDIWPKLKAEIRQYAQSRGWDLCGGIELSTTVFHSSETPETSETNGTRAPQDIVSVYAQNQKLTKPFLDYGLSLCS